MHKPSITHTYIFLIMDVSVSCLFSLLCFLCATMKFFIIWNASCWKKFWHPEMCSNSLMKHQSHNEVLSRISYALSLSMWSFESRYYAACSKLNKSQINTPWLSVPLCKHHRPSIQHSLIFKVTCRSILDDSNFYFLCVKDCKLCYMLKDNVDNSLVLLTAKDLSVSAAGANGLKLNVLHDCSM